MAWRPLDLARVVDRAVEEMRPQATEAGVTLTVERAGHRFDMLGDEDKLVQVVVNLVANGIRFTAAGGRVTARVVDAGRELEVQVEDTGAGIPAAALPRIFEMYEQAHAERGGTGLGLAIVRLRRGPRRSRQRRVAGGQGDPVHHRAAAPGRAGRRTVRAAVLVGAVLLVAGCATWPWRPASRLLDQGDALAARGDYAGAVRAWDELLARYPDDPAAPAALARRDTTAALLAAREELARVRGELAAREAELGRARQELARLGAEAERLRSEAERLRADLEHLKRIDLRLERRR
jgi:signal transduction histidine kinase